jgi:single-stranded-DNA-specific exonuclease
MAFMQKLSANSRNKEFSLIITVDVGITALRPATRARELGIDVIITDHHQPAEVLPDALGGR